jgi:gamma-glutamylcyclotransferase (GGCT)/AIG2-like uncharacterized protein YtfP
MHKLFTYGSLMCEDIMSAVVGGPLPCQPAILPDFQRLTMKDEQYPGVVPLSGGRVEGIVYQGIEEQGWNRLDRFEGEIYSRNRVVIRYPEDDGEETVCCYVVKPEYRQLLTTTPWDFKAFLQHGKKIFQTRYLGFKDII